MSLLGQLINIPAQVQKYLRLIGIGLAKRNSVEPKRVKIVIMFNESGNPLIAYYIDDVFRKYLTAEEIEILCSKD